MNYVQTDRLRGWFESLQDIEGAGERCPDAGRLSESVAGRLPIAEQESIALHMSVCGACAASWRLARELFAESDTAALQAPEHARPRWIGPAVAAAAVVVLATGVFLLQRPGGRDSTAPVFREGVAVELRSAVEPDTPLPRHQLLLRWSGAPPGTVYDLRVATESLEPLYRVFELDEPEHRVPADAVRELAPGSVVLWTVSARLPDGRRLPPATFRATLE